MKKIKNVSGFDSPDYNTVKEIIVTGAKRRKNVKILGAIINCMYYAIP